jgi:hypothetical protein
MTAGSEPAAETKPYPTELTHHQRPPMTNRLVSTLFLTFMAVSSAFFLSWR